MNNAYQQNLVQSPTARPKRPLSALLCAAALGFAGLTWFGVQGAAAEIDTNSALVNAVRNGDRQHIAALLQKGANPDVADAEGTPLLMNAVLYDDAVTVRMLLEHGADPNAKNAMGATALLWAAGDPDKVSLLLDKGADVNVTSALGRTPLLAAAGQDGASSVVKALLEKGADPNAKDKLQGPPVIPSGGGSPTPLIEAAKARDGQALQMLLAKNVEVNARDNNGGTALSEATILHNVDNVWRLLKAGADVSLAISTDKYTPLMLAAIRNDAGLVQMLLDAGADVNARDARGSTALMWAAYAERTDPEIVAMLVKAGADINAKNQLGESVLTWAKWNGQTPITAHLRKMGATDGPKAEKWEKATR